MRPLLFTFKRLALLAGPMMRAFSALVDLTPQRVDLMFFLRERPMIQRDLAFEMGVVRSVVSKMVTALEKLGIVERRGVAGDRRMRLVTLTQRAFDLMSLLLEHAPLDYQGNCLQVAGEHQMLADFDAPLRAKNVGVSELSLGDNRELLASMRARLFLTNATDWVWGARDKMPSRKEIAPVHSDWRATRCAWRADHVDGAVAKAHVDAGIPLDFVQRFPRRRRGNAGRGNAAPVVGSA